MCASHNAKTFINGALAAQQTNALQRLFLKAET